MKVGHWCNYHEGRATLRHYAKQALTPISSRGLLRDCEIFANLRLTFVSSSTGHPQMLLVMVILKYPFFSCHSASMHYTSTAQPEINVRGNKFDPRFVSCCPQSVQTSLNDCLCTAGLIKFA